MNVSRLAIASHTGTHVDAPYHFVEQGKTIDELPLDTLCGEAWVCHLSGPVGAAELQAAVPEGVSRLLVRTDNSLLWARDPDTFHRDFVALTLDAAHWITERGIQLLGIDYLSVEAYDSPGNPVHHLLLGAGVILVEGLDLSLLSSGWYNLRCLPLKVLNGDGAPARVIAEGPLEHS